METSKITIAVDGFAACGKSTLAKALAKKLGYVYVDSGAMYRAVTLYFLDHNIDIENPASVEEALQNINIHFENIEGKNHTFLNGEDVEDAIRTMRVSNFVSPVATISAVRKAMVKLQQAMGAKGGIAMDGRDIGTVVFKDAELKLFLTASIEERTRRRLAEWQSKGITDISPEEVEKNLRTRDHIDSTRADSPLCQAEDAIEIDNSLLTPTEQLEFALQLSKDIIEKKAMGLVTN
ncbi:MULTISPECIES: (d)CMP kinase [unclassified Aureispira]|uniref:(d)CMP kinase n=1 Tax=unclassified Aureispira TaxID=2649989 RepID=UPI000698D75D|nr:MULTISPECIES: (d)CMP kinase [unclassified Aureispira]WMX12154.1 (d)CMP kinase [Aureispira sp. CCB-E]